MEYTLDEEALIKYSVGFFQDAFPLDKLKAEFDNIRATKNFPVILDIGCGAIAIATMKALEKVLGPLCYIGVDPCLEADGIQVGQISNNGSLHCIDASDLGEVRKALGGKQVDLAVSFHPQFAFSIFGSRHYLFPFLQNKMECIFRYVLPHVMKENATVFVTNYFSREAEITKRALLGDPALAEGSIQSNFKNTYFLVDKTPLFLNTYRSLLENYPADRLSKWQERQRQQRQFAKIGSLFILGVVAAMLCLWKNKLSINDATQAVSRQMGFEL